MMLFIWDRDNIHFIMLDFKVETSISHAVRDQNSNTNTSSAVNEAGNVIKHN